jgi:phosphatidylserine/phosphatidylglycerophosphate/cardiolipin synthase-like enzyme
MQIRRAAVVAALALALAAPSFAQERLCDTSYEDCRTPILNMIRAEQAGLDVSFWFMTDARYATEIVRRWQAGVPVRILVDLRADENYPHNATVRQSLINAGIPMRHKVTPGINHWKMILYSGQSRMHFSAANFADGSYSPITPYASYVDEAIYFTDDPGVVRSFMTKFDDLWANTSHFADLANVVTRHRHYPTFPIDAALNFPPDQDYQDRLVSALRQETQQIDAMAFRVTSGKVPDELIRRHQAGVPVRVITDRRQYRNTAYFWHAYNIDRMFAAGIPIKWREGTDQDMHEKAVILYGRDMAVFGSSNWTASSSDSQREHNYFTTKAWFVDWLAAQFARKWNNLRADGSTITPALFNSYTPGWPEAPVNLSPAEGITNAGTSVVLRWEGGWWAHRYDIHFGTTNPPPLVARDFMPGAATAGVNSSRESFNPCAPPAPFASACPSGLAPGTTYYWMIRGKTMLGDVRRITGPVWSFTTTGGAPPPVSTGAQRVLADAYVRGGQYANTNFGGAPDLVAKFSADPALRRETYLKLDISGVQSGQTVRLRLFGRLSDTREPSVIVGIYPASSIAWGETTITWNNRPTSGTSQWNVVTVAGTSSRWYEIDLTQQVQFERSLGRTTIALVLKKTLETLPYVTFGSRNSSNPPSLVVQ